MTTIIIGLVIVALAVALVVAVARDSGPSAGEVAMAYELAWDRFDFDALWSLAGGELRDGLDRDAFVRAKKTAYANRGELRHLAADVTVDEVHTSNAYAIATTRITLRDASVVHNEVHLARRSGVWCVVGYQLAADTRPA